MKGLNLGLFILIFASLAMSASALEKSPSGDNSNYPPLSCLDRINNDPSGGDPAIDCADRTNGALTCPAYQFHPDACPNGELPICIPGREDYDGIYKAGWICQNGYYQPYEPTYPNPTYSPYEPTYNPQEPNWYGNPEPSYPVCGDGICSSNEYCFSDCGYQYDSGSYYLDSYYDYYGGSDYCYVSSPYFAQVGELAPISVYYFGIAPYSIQVDCGDGSVTTAYRNGYGANNFYGYCHYTYQGLFYPRAYSGYVSCGGSAVSVEGNYGAGYNPTYYPTYNPQATPYPTSTPITTPIPRPKCALTATPGAVLKGDSSILTVNYYDLKSAPNTISVDCGNGVSKNAVDCFEKSGSCSVFCNYQTIGSFSAVASALGTSCSPATVKVSEKTSDKCSDGTLFGTCSNSKPKYCDSGLLVDRADVCGCLDGKVESGNRCIAPNGYCSTTVTPAKVRANEIANVLINYKGIANSASTAKVICGNGQIQDASCTATDSVSGTCIASCAYSDENAYPANYIVRSSVNGISCSTANLQVIAPSESTGTLLAKVSSCESGQAISHAKISIENQNDYFTDANGQLKVALDPLAYNIEASKSGYLPTSTTVQITKGKISTANVCLKSVGCDISAQLVRTPNAGDSHSPLLYQIKITNNLNLENTVTIGYSSALFLQGPTTITLQASEAQTISILAFAPDRVIGNSFGTVSIKGSGDCAKNIDIPFNVPGGLSIEPKQNYKEGFSGKNVCFDLLVRNRGNNEGTVTLSYSSDLEGEFNAPQFYINPLETREDLEFCANVDSSKSGSHTIALRALSPFSDATSTVTLKVLDRGSFETDVGGSCIDVRKGEQYPITIDNDVADGDYAVILQGNDVNARISPSMLYNFKKGTSRTVYIMADNFDFGDSIVRLVLKKGSQVAMEEDICISDYRGHYNGRGRYDNGDGNYYNGGSGYGSSLVYSSLSPATLNIGKGQASFSTLTIRNSGRYGDNFYIRVDSPLTTSLSESSFYLAANEEKKVTIKVTAGNDAKRYSLPIKIYSGRGSGGVIYGGTGGTGSAFIKCGNGKTVSLNCDEGSSSCSASCKYDDVGSYTIDANVGNEKCEDTKIRVIPENSRGCAISTESFAREDTSVNVKVKYYDLPQDIPSDEISVYCGNGNTEIADDCDGRSGTCFATCEYTSKGTFTVGASAGGIGCTSAEIKVGSDSSYCSISSQGIVEDGDIAGVSLKYRNVNFGSQFFDYNYANNDGNYYSNGRLLKTENLVVAVSGGGLTPTIEPSDLSPDSLEIKKVIVSQLPSTGKANIAVSIKNNRDYKLAGLLALFENLPDGVSANQVPPFDLDSKSERTIYLRLEANGAAIGNYRPKIVIRLDSQTIAKEFDLKIGSESGSLNVEVDVGEISYSQTPDGAAVANVNFLVRNLEQAPIQVSALLVGFDENWSVAVEPGFAQIKPGKALNFSANLTAKEFEAKSYEGEIQLRSNDGRRYSSPLVVEFSKIGLFSGLFTFLGNTGGIAIGILLILAALALYTFFGKRESDEQTSADADGNVSKKLQSIGDEIGSEKGEFSLNEEKFSKKVKWEGSGGDGKKSKIRFDVGKDWEDPSIDEKIDLMPSNEDEED
ncbi:carboxypeptidase regulatory-like domain-containing protein [Candidatus Micrarchaeota archaeon]|nr:carboxypeptidase regulatory-like domain-containing protein [Candidatus Micrarchaeota archaeon]